MQHQILYPGKGGPVLLGMRRASLQTDQKLGQKLQGAIRSELNTQQPVGEGKGAGCIFEGTKRGDALTDSEKSE